MKINHSKMSPIPKELFEYYLNSDKLSPFEKELAKHDFEMLTN